MKNNALNKFFVILVSVFIITTPVAYAQQISFQTKGGGVSGDYGNYEKPLAEASAIVSELVINVSENGSVTIVGPPGITIGDSSFPAANAESTGKVALQADANTCSDAIALNLGTNYYAYIDYAGDIDWFKWNLPSSGKFTADMDVPSNRDYELKVYTSCSNEVCSSNKGKGSDEKCETNTGPGWVYAKMWGYKNDYSKSDKYYIKGSFAASKQHDLEAYSFTVTPSSPTDGDSISVLYKIKNNGPDDITSYFNFKLYIDDQHKQTCNANNGLKSGWYGHCTRDDLSLSAGTHVLKLVADADSSIAETNENNNVKTEDLPVTHVPQYDLVPGSFTVTPSSPKDSDSITVRYRATNNGPDDVSTSYNYKLYIDDAYQQTCTASDRPAGTTGYCEKDGIKLSAGQHTLKNVVDADNSIAETNENNNQLENQLTVASSCVDNDGDGYGSGCSNGSDCNDNDANINPGKSEVCGDGVDNDCNGQADENCCQADNPYYCQKTEPKPCWDKKERCDSSLKCGGEWWACTEPSKYSPKCVDSKPGCCLPQYPYYCPDNNYCFSQNGLCDGRKVYTCLGKSQVCNTKTDIGTCFGDTLRCCPPGENWWESDKQCHKSSEPPKCNVPDGSSANCDCDTNADCPSNKPYCGEGGSQYDIRTPQGFHACLTEKPQYCGDGTCNNNENYNTCNQDCTAPTGTIKADVYNPNTKAAVSGAKISVDSVFKTTTDANGKASITASYGNRNLKVECPDSKLCETRTIKVDGNEYANFGCGCNPAGDSDGDGYLDKDELLLGTDIKNANSNFQTTFASDSVDLLACIPTPASFFILWKEYKKSGSIIQSHSLVVNSLNTTSITSASLDEGPYAVAQALSAAGFEAEGAEVIVNPVNVTLENVMKKAEYVDGVRMQDGLLLIATDKDGQTTALIAIGAGCVGAFSGAVYGIGQGLFDDIKGVIDGIWFLITHLDDVKKIWSGAVELVNGIRELFSKPGEAFWSMFTGILEKGQGINLFKNDRANNPDPYRHFQVGFVYGFVTGYLVEQVALGAAILKNVAKFFKLGQLFGKTGKATKILEKLNIIKASEEFGAEIAEKLSKLKYLKEGIENWADSEIKGLARIMKHNEGWLKGLSETEAKIAAKHADELAAAGKVTDEAFGDLTKTKLGQHTLKTADATTDLLAKQSKLVSKWGTKKADEVVNKCVAFVCYGDRIDDLNKLLKPAPDEFVNKLEIKNAQGLISYEHLDELTEALNELKNVKSFDEVAETLAKQNTWTGPAYQLRKGLKLKKAGNTIVEFERDIGTTKIDIVYTKTGTTTEMFMEVKNTISRTYSEELGDQLQNYYNYAGTWERVRLSSGNNIPSNVISSLEARFGKEAVKKLLSG